MNAKEVRTNCLQAMREKSGLSQPQLAQKTKVAVSMIRKYEQNYRDIDGAKLSTLLKICEALNCEIADILNDGETKNQLCRYEKARRTPKK